MKRFSELLSGKEKQVDVIACQWCENQIKSVPESEWLNWAKSRWGAEELTQIDGMNLTKFYENHDHDFTYARFISGVTECCSVFYFANGGEMSEARKRLHEKMQ